jgi:hypothetical protein
LSRTTPRRWTPTRGRQAGLGALGLGGAVALFPMAGHYMLEASSSLALNLGLQAGLMALVFGGSYLLALTLVGLLWPHRFGSSRLLEIAAPPIDLDDDDDDLTLSAGQMQGSGTRLFALALVLILIGSVTAANQLSQGVLFRQREIRTQTVLRSDRDEARVRVLREVGQAETRALIEAYIPTVWRVAREDASAPIRVEALWTLAELAERMRRSVLIRHAEAELQGWEKGLVERMRADYADALVEHFRAATREELRPCFRLLIHLDPERALDLSDIYLNHPDPSPELLLDMAQLLPRAADLRAAAVLAELMRRAPPVRLVALISQARLLRLFDPEKRGEEIPALKRFNRKLDRALRKTEDHRSLCAAAEALFFLKDDRYARRLMALYDDATLFEVRCERLAVQDHMGREDVLMAEEELYYKTLRALSQIAVGSDEIKAFFEGRLDNPDLPENLRREFRNLLKLLRKAEGEP